jgi:hypothetical protein
VTEADERKSDTPRGDKLAVTELWKDDLTELVLPVVVEVTLLTSIEVVGGSVVFVEFTSLTAKASLSLSFSEDPKRFVKPADICPESLLGKELELLRVGAAELDFEGISEGVGESSPKESYFDSSS